MENLKLGFEDTQEEKLKKLADDKYFGNIDLTLIMDLDNNLDSIDELKTLMNKLKLSDTIKDKYIQKLDKLSMHLILKNILYNEFAKENILLTKQVEQLSIHCTKH